MFAGGDGRSKLDHLRVFKGNEDLKLAHEKFDNLRNKQYAHKELEHDRHQVSYFVDNQGVIAIDIDGIQHTRQHQKILTAYFFICNKFNSFPLLNKKTS